MTISLRVDSCDTCKGDGYDYDSGGMGGRPNCPTCGGRGWTLPGWPWVKVPMVVHGGEHDGATAWYAPDPRWRPGATVTLAADCMACEGGVGFWRGNAWCDGPCIEHVDGQVTVGSAVFTKIIRVDEAAPGHLPDINYEPGDVLARLEVTS